MLPRFLENEVMSGSSVWHLHLLNSPDAHDVNEVITERYPRPRCALHCSSNSTGRFVPLNNSVCHNIPGKFQVWHFFWTIEHESMRVPYCIRFTGNDIMGEVHTSRYGNLENAWNLLVIVPTILRPERKHETAIPSSPPTTTNGRNMTPFVSCTSSLLPIWVFPASESVALSGCANVRGTCHK